MNVDINLNDFRSPPSTISDEQLHSTTINAGQEQLHSTIINAGQDKHATTLNGDLEVRSTTIDTEQTARQTARQTRSGGKKRRRPTTSDVCSKARKRHDDKLYGRAVNQAPPQPFERQRLQMSSPTPTSMTTTTAPMAIAATTTVALGSLMHLKNSYVGQVSRRETNGETTEETRMENAGVSYM